MNLSDNDIFILIIKSMKYRCQINAIKYMCTCTFHRDNLPTNDVNYNKTIDTEFCYDFSNGVGS